MLIKYTQDVILVILSLASESHVVAVRAVSNLKPLSLAKSMIAHDTIQNNQNQ